VRFYLDEDLPPAVAASRRRRGLDVQTTAEAGNQQFSDRAQLEHAAKAGRCLVTRNVRDFIHLAREALQRQRPHAGILLCSLAYRGDEIRRMAEALAKVAAAYPAGLGEYDVIFL
jgi:predicted nuclease of predicted toxin-antitoxin system